VVAQHVSDARAPRLDEFARGRDRLREPVRRVEEREWLPIPDPSVHHPAGLGQVHVLVRDDAVLPTALLVEESGEVPLSLVGRRHPLRGGFVRLPAPTPSAAVLTSETRDDVVARS